MFVAVRTHMDQRNRDPSLISLLHIKWIFFSWNQSSCCVLLEAFTGLTHSHTHTQIKHKKHAFRMACAIFIFIIIAFRKRAKTNKQASLRLPFTIRSTAYFIDAMNDKTKQKIKYIRSLQASTTHLSGKLFSILFRCVYFCQWTSSTKNRKMQQNMHET